MQDFVAIDFETANYQRSSVCSVGIVTVRTGKIVDQFYSLIRPLPNYYTAMNTAVHGLCRQDTDDAPSFPEVWAEILPRLGDLPLVAHNKAFDASCLRAVLEAYRLSYPDNPFLCTLSASRRHFGKALPNHQLHTVARACGYDLKAHHHALADAEACAMIALQIL